MRKPRRSACDAQHTRGRFNGGVPMLIDSFPEDSRSEFCRLQLLKDQGALLTGVRQCRIMAFASQYHS
jgi:hypothetical protein